jgi:hypothetical protein
MRQPLPTLEILCTYVGVCGRLELATYMVIDRVQLMTRPGTQETHLQIQPERLKLTSMSRAAMRQSSTVHHPSPAHVLLEREGRAGMSTQNPDGALATRRISAPRNRFAARDHGAGMGNGESSLGRLCSS